MLNKILLTIIVMFVFCTSTSVYSLVDPTKPPTYSKKSTVNINNTNNKNSVTYVLNAIKVSNDSRLAIINGDQYVIGQSIGDSRVKSILSTHVLLTSGKVLSLFDNKSNHVVKKGY